MRFEADRVDTRVRTLPAGHMTERVEDVDVLVVQRLSTALGRRELKSFGEAIDGNDAFGAKKEGAANCELTHGAAAPYGNSVARLDVAHFRAHISGGKDV